MGKQVVNNQLQHPEIVSQAGRHLGKAGREQSSNHNVKLFSMLGAILGKQVANNQLKHPEIFSKAERHLGKVGREQSSNHSVKLSSRRTVWLKTLVFVL